MIHCAYIRQLFSSVQLICSHVLSGAAVMLAELAVEAGLPNGVLNIVHGSNVSF